MRTDKVIIRDVAVNEDREIWPKRIGMQTIVDFSTRFSPL